MRITLLAIYSLFFASGHAQEPALVFMDTVNDQSLIRLTSYNSYSSNRFDNEFMDKFLFGGQISNELKDRQQNRLKYRNVLGGEFEQRIDAQIPGIKMFGKEDYGMKLSFSDNHYFSADIKGDLFNLAMYGNGPYVGDTMDFTFSSLHYEHFQKFGIGFFNKHNLSSIQISYIFGSKGLKGGLDQSYLYSHPEGDSVDVFTNGQMIMTDRYFPYWGFQGNGFSIDVDYNFIFEGKSKNRQIINFKINNLGIIFWNSPSKNYFMANNGTYSGFNIQDLMNQDSTVDNSVNWMDTLGITETPGHQIDVLPIELVVQKLADHGIDAKWQPIFGFKAIMIPEYFPYLYAGVYYKPTQSFSLSSRLSYGGWAGLRWGLNFNYWLKDKMYIGAGTFDVMGLVSKKIGFGRGFNFSMYFKI